MPIYLTNGYRLPIQYNRQSSKYIYRIKAYNAQMESLWYAVSATTPSDSSSGDDDKDDDQWYKCGATGIEFILFFVD